MNELEIAQEKLAQAEIKLKEKEHEWFVIRFIVTPSVLSLVVALVAVTIALIKNL